MICFFLLFNLLSNVQLQMNQISANFNYISLNIKSKCCPLFHLLTNFEMHLACVRTLMLNKNIATVVTACRIIFFSLLYQNKGCLSYKLYGCLILQCHIVAYLKNEQYSPMPTLCPADITLLSKDRLVLKVLH